MMQRVLVHFPWPTLTGVGLLLFFAVFVGVVLWVSRKGSSGFYARMEHLPFHEGEVERSIKNKERRSVYVG